MCVNEISSHQIISSSAASENLEWNTFMAKSGLGHPETLSSINRFYVQIKIRIILKLFCVSCCVGCFVLPTRKLNEWLARLLTCISMVSCQKGPTRHAYAWQIGPFRQDTLDMCVCVSLPQQRKNETYWLHTTPKPLTPLMRIAECFERLRPSQRLIRLWLFASSGHPGVLTICHLSLLRDLYICTYMFLYFFLTNQHVKAKHCHKTSGK